LDVGAKSFRPGDAKLSKVSGGFKVAFFKSRLNALGANGQGVCGQRVSENQVQKRIFGIRSDCLGLPLKPALEFAAKFGLGSVQINYSKEFTPNNMSETARRHLAHFLQTQSLKLVAIGVGNRRGLEDVNRLEERIRHFTQMIQLSAEMKSPIVVANIGTPPKDADSPARRNFEDALARVSEAAIRTGVTLTLETGPMNLDDLANFLAEHQRLGLGVAFDPANLVARGQDPFSGISKIADAIKILHIKDIVRTMTTVSGFREVPIGEGELDFGQLSNVLAGIDFRGAWIIERDDAVISPHELRHDVEFLSNL
jgi:sugar phosphate isomerase/epimerase